MNFINQCNTEMGIIRDSNWLLFPDKKLEWINAPSHWHRHYAWCSSDSGFPPPVSIKKQFVMYAWHNCIKVLQIHWYGRICFEHTTKGHPTINKSMRLHLMNITAHKIKRTVNFSHFTITFAKQFGIRKKRKDKQTKLLCYPLFCSNSLR